MLSTRFVFAQHTQVPDVTSLVEFFSVSCLVQCICMPLLGAVLLAAHCFDVKRSHAYTFARILLPSGQVPSPWS